MKMTNLQPSAHAFLTHGTPWHTSNVTVPTEDWHLERILLPLEPACYEWVTINIPMREAVKGKWKKREKKSIFTVIIQTVFIALFLCKRQYNLFLGCYLHFFPPIYQSLPL